MDVFKVQDFLNETPYFWDYGLGVKLSLKVNGKEMTFCRNRDGGFNVANANSVLRFRWCRKNQKWIPWIPKLVSLS